MIWMAPNDVLCKRVVDNIRNLNRELRNLDERRREIMNNVEKQLVEIRQAEDDLAKLEAYAPVSSIVRVLGGTAALSVVAGAANEIEKSKARSRIRYLQRELKRIKSPIEEIDRKRERKLELIRESQRDFSHLGCFKLGFSHEVLNLP